MPKTEQETSYVEFEPLQDAIRVVGSVPNVSAYDNQRIEIDKNSEGQILELRTLAFKVYTGDAIDNSSTSVHLIMDAHKGPNNQYEKIDDLVEFVDQLSLNELTHGIAKITGFTGSPTSEGFPTLDFSWVVAPSATLPSGSHAFKCFRQKFIDTAATAFSVTNSVIFTEVRNS